MAAMGEKRGVRPLTDLADLYAQFPRLSASGHRITSEPSDLYNCVAWVERDFERWWEPGFHWPLGAKEPSGDADVDCYVDLFEKLGFERCDSSDAEPGFLKIALYAENHRFHHVAKQLPSGAWSSKAGPLHDFRHEALTACDDCGVMRAAQPELFMRRSYDGADDMSLEETGLILLSEDKRRIADGATESNASGSEGEDADIPTDPHTSSTS